MELWIRNQEKDHLIKIEEINIEIDDDGFVGIWSYGSNKYLKWYLGNYATKERALEVLDEIQRKIKPEYMLRHINRPDEPSQYEGYYEEKPTIIYEMPQE